MLKKTLLIAVALFACAVSAEIAELKTAAARCLVDLDGARIVSFSVGGEEILWNAHPPQKDAADWAHGGIPVCWPFFGIDASGDIHGIAWRKPFRLAKRSESAAQSTLVAELEKENLRLKCSITLTDALTLEMTTENSGTNLCKCSYGYHPYFRVGERDLCTVGGVDGFSFEDDPSVANRKSGIWHGTVGLTTEIDRIFALPKNQPMAFTLHDTAGSRLVTITSEGATHLNIWNPGAAKNCPGVVPGEEWRHFVCVEPIVLAAEVPPLGKKTLKMTIEAKKIGK